MKLIIVSGLSGSGKTVALRTLEDDEFYCIDNLHLGLLDAFVRQLTSPDIKLFDKAAVGIDARSGIKDIACFPEMLDTVKASGLDADVFFLQAEVTTLVKRFSETRRRHPLTHSGLPLMDAIKMERALLTPVAAQADLILDTTQMNVHQLRQVVRQRVHAGVDNALSLLFQSFAFKNGVPTDADFVFDVRCLPNPHWVAELRRLTGQDAPVIAYLEAHPEVEAMYQSIRGFLNQWLPRFQAENRAYLTVSIGCTGGQHRSVYLAERLVQHFRSALVRTATTRHRELA